MSAPDKDETDPIAARAALLKDQQMEKLQYFSDPVPCKLAWKAAAFADDRALVWVESPTSKPKVPRAEV